MADPTAANGTRRPLTQARVVELALGIIDREGLGALNMRRLAAAAGVKPMSLYHHFRGKGAIHAVAEAIAAAAVGLPPTGADWRDQVRFLFVGLHLAGAASTPRALPLISSGAARTPSGRRWMEALMAALLEAGFTPPARAASVYHALGAYTLGLGYAALLALDLPAAGSWTSWSATGADYRNPRRAGLRLTAWDRPGEFETGLDASR